MEDLKTYGNEYKTFELVVKGETVKVGLKDLPAAVKYEMVDAFYRRRGRRVPVGGETKRTIAESLVEEIYNMISNGIFLWHDGVEYVVDFDCAFPEPTITAWDYRNVEYAEDVKLTWFEVGAAFMFSDRYCFFGSEFDEDDEEFDESDFDGFEYRQDYTAYRNTQRNYSGVLNTPKENDGKCSENESVYDYLEEMKSNADWMKIYESIDWNGYATVSKLR